LWDDFFVAGSSNFYLAVIAFLIPYAHWDALLCCVIFFIKQPIFIPEFYLLHVINSHQYIFVEIKDKITFIFIVRKINPLNFDQFMRTQIPHPKAFYFVVLKRRIPSGNKHTGNPVTYLAGKRTLLFAGLIYTLAVGLIITFLL